VADRENLALANETSRATRAAGISLTACSVTAAVSSPGPSFSQPVLGERSRIP
jgi:hypothetical protein